MQPPAIVMNMFYTGLGIARSLGERGIPVVGLSAQRGLYGNFTRYADVRRSPDSRKQPAELFEFLMKLGQESAGPQIIFPTRDDDVVFLDSYRQQLSRHFVLAIPSHAVIKACLDKWETHQWAERAGIAAPRAWMIHDAEELPRVVDEITYPCVLKPVASYDWHRGSNWDLVGGRKAIGITSREEFLLQYRTVSAADQRVLVEEMVQGGDDQLFIAACCCNSESQLVAGFTARKLVQIPAGFGTGCIVRAVECPEVLALAERLLAAMRFTGIAEVEFKRDSADGEFKLIEINARPWDQHRLGHAYGTDVIYHAYREYAGLPTTSETTPSQAPKVTLQVKQPGTHSWIAEDAYAMAFLRSLRTNRAGVSQLLRASRGKRIFAIWYPRDPLPFITWMLTFAVRLATLCCSFLSTRLTQAIRRVFRTKLPVQTETNVYGFERSKSKS